MTKAAELAQVASTGVSEGFKNRIINGAMTIAQRATSVTGANGYSVTDRFDLSASTIVWNATQSTDVPSGTGFRNSTGLTITTASSAAGAYAYIYHAVEGYNWADLNYGTATAQTSTLSFWVKSSVTGTFGIALRNTGTARFFTTTYTINSANTWEQKTITITGDTSGTWNTTNGIGMSIFWDLGVGSTYSSTSNNAWSTVGSNFFGVSGTTKLGATNGATFYITGVQLEVGSTASSFDYRPYGTELALCQRYYEKSFPINTKPANGLGTTEGTDFSAYYSGGGRTRSFDFRVIKRATPTITVYGGTPSGAINVFGYYNYSTWGPFTTTSPESVSDSAFRCECTKSGSFTNGLTYLLDGNWTASAEL